MKTTKWTLMMLVVVTLSTLFIQSCVKDNFDMKKLTTNNLKWNPNLAVPIVNSTISLDEVLNEINTTLIYADANNLLHIKYGEEIASVTAEDLIKFPDQNFDAFSFTTLGTSDVYYSETREHDFSVDNFERLDSMVVKAGVFTINTSSTINYPGTLIFTFSSIKQNGTPLKISVPITNGTNTVNHVLDNSVYENMYRVNLAGTGIQNKLPVKIEVLFETGGQVIPAGGNVSANIQLNNVKYKAVYGFLGQKTININTDSLVLSMFAKAFGEDIYFENPQFNVTINNSFGIPTSVTFPSIGAYSKITDATFPISMPPSFSPLNIAAPSVSELGQYKETKDSVTPSNSNIRAVMSHLPKYIIYSVEGKLNPNQTSGTNFVLDTSKFKVRVDVDLPLVGHMSDYLLQDTTAFNISDMLKETDKIDWVMFRLALDNGFPVDGRIQGYFCDTNYVVLDSLFESSTEVFQSGELDSGGKVYKKTLKTNDITFPKARVDDLASVRFLLFKIYLKTTNGEPIVRFYSDYNIGLRFGMQAKLNLKLN